jgi:lipoyl(octanoyl) transferase
LEHLTVDELLGQPRVSDTRFACPRIGGRRARQTLGIRAIGIQDPPGAHFEITFRLLDTARGYSGCEMTERLGYLLNLGSTPYREACELQRSLAAAVSQGAMPDTIVLLEHPPVITLGRRAGEEELHVPADAEVEVVETDRGGKSTYHGPGQLVGYPILDLNRHGRDVKKYCRDLEEAVIRTLAAFDLAATRLDGLTGVWLDSPPRKICSIGVHISRWVTTHGYALNVDLDPAPFSEWITACGLEDASFTTMARELGPPLTMDEVRSAAAAALGDVFRLALEELPADEGTGLWAQPVHERIAAKPTRATRSGEAVGVEQVPAHR